MNRPLCRKVLDCASPLALFDGLDASKSARGLAQSKTLSRGSWPQCWGLLAFASAFVWAHSVAGANEPPPFRTGILPLLTKAGCNAGACHGAATGQGGFRLSLLGYDPEEDYDRITREHGGRRIDRTAPAHSLLLQKPSGQLEHEGGRRLPRNSEAYQKLQRWIAAGVPYGPRDLRVVSIEVSPDDSFLPTTNSTLALRVTAALSDGSREDVTGLSLYSSNDDAIAEVGKQGDVRVVGRGVTSIMVRYSGQVAAARVAVPFGGTEIANDEFTADHWIDRHIVNELKRLRLPPSLLSSDAEFLRRVHLDLIGRLPTADEARAFLGKRGTGDPPVPSGDPPDGTGETPPTREDARLPAVTPVIPVGGSPTGTGGSPVPPAERRQRIIDALLEREEFVDLWTMRLADLLLISGKRGSEEATRAYHEWLRAQVARNTPFDQLTRTLLTASGRLTTDPPANFFTLATDPRDLAEHAGRIFLGTQIACARCHAHPADRWTQEDYHRFAACFARVSREGDLIRVSTRGEVDHPKTGEPLSPRPLGARGGTADDATDRRIELARWMTSREAAPFARTIVNRIWKHLLGRGLVEPVDDLRPTNPPTHPALLEALAQDFATHNYDMRRLIRLIVSTRTYQLTSRTRGLNRLDDRFYSHALLKELPAPVFLDAVAQVTGVPESFPGYPEGTRAVQLVGARTPSYALDVLGRCPRDTTCEGGGRRGGGLAQALHLVNGPIINGRLHSGNLAQWLARNLSDREIIEELYLRAFTRRPAPPEFAEWERLFGAASNRNEAVEDLFWTLLNSREFAFNH